MFSSVTFNYSIHRINVEQFVLFLEESGIVAQVSEPLTDATCSTFYICSFHTDHLLVCTLASMVNHSVITNNK